MKYKEIVDYLLETQGAVLRIAPQQEPKKVARAIRSGVWRCIQRYNALLLAGGRAPINRTLLITELETDTGIELELTLTTEPPAKPKVQFQVVTPNFNAVDTTSLPD